MAIPECRFCGRALSDTFADLGVMPLANAYLSADRLDSPEPHYPLHARVCPDCFLVQVGQFETPQQIFGDYAYFSSYSPSWLEHCRRYSEMAIERFALTPASRVVELASNDGYLLQFFALTGLDVLGVEPAANVARVAIEKGIPTEVCFFGVEAARRLAAEGRGADLLIANNVLAHVPDLNDFVAGMKLLLAPSGAITLEFPHLLRLMEHNQFDTIYHEHFSYFSFMTVRRILAAHGLDLFDVEELPTHGGSLRVYARHAGAGGEIADSVVALLALERHAGLDRLDAYRNFDRRIQSVKRDLLAFLIEAKRAGKSVAAYGAAAKGNTLLNYCGARTDFIDFVADRSPHKQGLFLPGTRILIVAPERIEQDRPDYVLILAWNLRQEIMSQLAGIRQWGGRFVTPIPRLEIWD